MKKLFKNAVFLAILSAIGFFAYKLSTKLKNLKQNYEKTIFFNGKNMKLEGEEFRGCSYALMFSGLDIDLSGATLKDDDVTLTIYGEFSGISIRVPDDFQVQVEGEADKSGVSNTTSYDADEEFKPVLRIRYNIKYSGLRIAYANESEKCKCCN